MWTDLLFILVPVIIGAVVVRLLGEVAVPKDKLGNNPARIISERPRDARPVPRPPEADVARPDDDRAG